ncbi:MAG: twin-arginine translocation signal domain-containing protein, partial [Kiritimatiellae bacterium]|nr:twin-arginine translocation signal domain-containing protein [Kiritimatiellia bacterium]
MESITRRGFLAAATAATAGAAIADDTAAKEEVRDPFLGTQGEPLKVGAPCLQSPAETTMGVSWAVSGLSKGVVEYADNPAMINARVQKSGGYGLLP